MTFWPILLGLVVAVVLAVVTFFGWRDGELPPVFPLLFAGIGLVLVGVLVQMVRSK
jgi:hypothetical protein